MILRIKHEHREFIFDVDSRPTNNCHASTIARLADGSLIAAWFVGSKEGCDDVAIWTARKCDGTWSEPEIAAAINGEPQWNPVLHVRQDGRIALFFKTGKPIPQWRTMVCFSDDIGRSWVGHREAVPGDVGGRGPVKNKAIRLADGTLAAPASLEGDKWDAFVDLSADDGVTWTMSARVPIRRDLLADGLALRTDSQDIFTCRGKGVIQPTLWESAPGRVHMLLRSTGGYIYRSDSTDDGRSWGLAYRTGLLNNNSGIDLVRLDDGVLVLCCNPTGIPEGQWGGPRTPLVLLQSSDDGLTWEHLYTFEDIEGEFSYPAIIADERRLLVTYTWRRATIRFVELELG